MKVKLKSLADVVSTPLTVVVVGVVAVEVIAVVVVAVEVVAAVVVAVEVVAAVVAAVEVVAAVVVAVEVVVVVAAVEVCVSSRHEMRHSAPLAVPFLSDTNLKHLIKYQ